MKNSGRWIPVSITVVFVLAVFGTFLYRQQGGSPFISLSETKIATESTYSEINSVFQDGKININTASADDLTLLPDIGEKIAERIVAYRNENGPFQHVDELIKVSGIGPHRLNAILNYITLGG